jgi:hypothetical protein
MKDCSETQVLVPLTRCGIELAASRRCLRLAFPSGIRVSSGQLLLLLLLVRSFDCDPFNLFDMHSFWQTSAKTYRFGTPYKQADT